MRALEVRPSVRVRDDSARGRMPDGQGPARQWPLRALLALFLVSAIWVLVADRHKIGHALAGMDWRAVVIAAISGTLAVLCMFAAWREAVAGGGAELSTRDSLRIYAIGQVGKYLPGA